MVRATGWGAVPGALGAAGAAVRGHQAPHRTVGSGGRAHLAGPGGDCSGLIMVPIVVGTGGKESGGEQWFNPGA